MTQDVLHTDKLGWRARVEIGLGRCPTCGGRLKSAELPELVENWAFQYDKSVARTLGNRPVPKGHSTTTPGCRYCDRCQRWYQGRWAYWKTLP